MVTLVAVFTGIVGGLGRVAEVGAGRLGVQHAAIAGHLGRGASVAVNGVCLTVTGIAADTFFADVVPETLARTNLGRLAPGETVNVELPLAASQRLDGHLVQGHVDTTASVRSVREVALGRELEIELPPALAPFVAEKGSIAVDGVSLTVAAVDDSAGTFSVALIPHTLALTVAGGYEPGSPVNLEVDVVARYVDRLMNKRNHA